MAIDQPLTTREFELLSRESREPQTLTGASALQARLLYDIALRLDAIRPAPPLGATGAAAVAEIAGPVPAVAAPPASAAASARSEAIELSELLESARTLLASLQQARDDPARHEPLLNDVARIVRAEAQASLNAALGGIRGGVDRSVAEIMGAIAGLQKACECKAPGAGPVNVIISDLLRPADSILETIKADQRAIAELRCSLDEAVEHCGELKSTVSTLCEFRDWAKPTLDRAQIDSCAALEAARSARESCDVANVRLTEFSGSLVSVQDECVQQTLRSDDQQVSIDGALAEIAALRRMIEERCGELSGRCDHLLERHKASEAAMAKLAERLHGDAEHHPPGGKPKTQK